MGAETHQPADEVKRLTAGINDLLGVGTSSGRGQPYQIVQPLLELLVTMLRLDLVYARLEDPFGGPPFEIVHLARPLDPAVSPQDLGRALAAAQGGDSQPGPLIVHNPLGDGDLSIVLLRLGPQGRAGVMVAAAPRPDFPGEIESLLLRVAATEATLRLQEARLSREDGRPAGGLDHRMAQATRELEAVNEQLRTEIVEHKRAEQKLRQDESELRRIIDAIPHAITVLGPDGSTLDANAVALDYLGITIEDVRADESRVRRFHPDDVERLRDERQRALRRGEPFDAEMRARRKDGQYRWFLIRYNPLRDNDGNIIRWYATGTDIDDRKRAEERVHGENLALREELDRSSMFEEIVGSAAPLRKVLAQVAKVAPTDSTVLILGETGTGKELIARAIHKRSARSKRAFIRVNCAAIPSSLIASELFGHEKGAFTGAVQRRVGRFEAADGGTILLDEIGELPLETQSTLLRVLQEREVERVGSSQPIPVDVRILAASNRDLESAVAAGTFRHDLFFRLNVFPIQVPALRERANDIPLLVEYLIDRYARRAAKKIRSIEGKAMKLLQAYQWPGNIRELQNVIERAVILCDSDTFVVEEAWLKSAFSAESSRMPVERNSLRRVDRDREKETIEAALAACEGRIAGPSGAAAKLGIPRQTLESRIASLGINKYRFKSR
jgi:formate hydrogenlyase transcriptional activator